jgi:starch-binding outer membrane protein, SusD/RagB family
MMRFKRSLAVLGAVAVLGACSELTDLDVENPNNPDAGRALASADDVEGLISSQFFNWFVDIRHYYPGWALSVGAGEVSSSWGNYGMQDWGTIPRIAYQNNTTYGYRGVNQNPWYRMYGVVSSTNDALQAIDGGMQFGEGGANTARGRAFAKFAQGLAYARIGMLYDQAFLVDETMDLTAIQFQDVLVPYQDVMQAAIGMLDEAAQIASSNSFTIPAGWIPASPQITSDGLARLARSFSARFIAQAARTPEERAAVPWADVVSRINAGITQDFIISLDGDTWWDGVKQYAGNPTWQRASLFTIGEADTTGAYEAWLNTPAAQRQPFDIQTADRRITGAAGPQSPGKYFGYKGASPFQAARGSYFFSSYMLTRYGDAAASTGLWPNWNGDIPYMTMVEMDLLRAEAYLRGHGGSKQEAADLINKTRVSNGELPPVDASMSDAQLMAAMQYEKRIELFSLTSGGAFFDARGWGRLVSGTPLNMPMPALELETLGFPIYTFGGPAGGGAQ